MNERTNHREDDAERSALGWLLWLILIACVGAIIADTIYGQQSYGTSNPGQVAPPKGKPVKIFTMRGCGRCVEGKHDFDRLREYDVTYVQKPAEWTKFVHDRLAAGETFPFVTWPGKGGKLFYLHGGSQDEKLNGNRYVGPEDFVRRHDASLR